MGHHRSMLPFFRIKCRVCHKRKRMRSATARFCSDACKMKAYRRSLIVKRKKEIASLRRENQHASNLGGKGN